MTELLKKNAFNWCPEATTVNEKLKEAMVTTPVLALPNFDREFTIETNASRLKVDAILT